MTRKGEGQPAARRSTVRLADIAARLGLTKVAISKALRGHADIAPHTRELVARAAAEMGYLPDHRARSLQAGRSNIIGVVMPKIRHAFFAEVLSGIQAAAAAAGYEVLLGVSQEDEAAERRHIETFLSMRVDALLVSVTSRAAGNAAIYAAAGLRGVPIVFFDRTPAAVDGEMRAVVMDDRAGAAAATRRAWERGYRRIAHLAGYPDVNIGRDRRLGYEDALRGLGIGPDPALVLTGGYEEADGFDGFSRLWSCAERPDAVFCASFPVALGAIDAMRAIAPEAVGKVLIVFFGLSDMIRFLPRPHLCVVQPAASIGARSVEEALQAIADPAYPASRTVVPLTLLDDGEPRHAPA